MRTIDYGYAAFADQLAALHNVDRAGERIDRAAAHRERGDRQRAAAALTEAGIYRRAAVCQRRRAARFRTLAATQH